MKLVIPLQATGFLVMFLASSGAAFAQGDNPCIHRFDVREVNFTQNEPVPVEDVGPQSPAQVLASIMKAQGLQRPIGILEWPDFGNACASFNPTDGKRYIYFDPNWLLQATEGGYWPLVLIIAHELGHHVNNHSREDLTRVSTWQIEYEADVFAGRVLSLLEAPKEMISVLAKRFPEEATPSHPPRHQRVASLWFGYSGAELDFSLATAPAYNEEVLERVAQSIEQGDELGATTAIQMAYSAAALNREFQMIADTEEVEVHEWNDWMEFDADAEAIDLNEFRDLLRQTPNVGGAGADNRGPNNFIEEGLGVFE